MDIRKLQSDAERGSTVAKAILGICYLDGVDVAPDHDKALSLLQEAAAERVPRALFYLGRMYESGLGVTRDVGRATDLYTETAEAGEFLACVQLARLKRTAGDAMAARKWYERAAAMSDRIHDCPELREALGYARGERPC